MADSAPTPASSSPSTSPATTGSAPANRGRLETDRGTTTIAEIVVTKVAGIAAREVSGVHRLGGTVARALGAVTQRLPGGDSTTQGVDVEVTESDAQVQISVVIDYGESIPTVAQAIRDNVVRRIEATTGLHVSGVDISVTDLYFPGDDDESAS
jgi:uncharacterized alkaline shock family protein YloU